MADMEEVPRHVAIIMDGNGRWAAKRGLPRIVGHTAGVKSARNAVEAARELGVKILTLYTFSTENWKRPKSEIEALFNLLEDYLDKEGDRLGRNDIRFQVIGRISELPDSLRKKIEERIRKTRGNKGLILNLALNYGARTEIIDAVRAIAALVKAGTIDAGDIDEKTFSEYLYTKALPDPDLLIRTSGEFRISNFLLWQLSYSEIYISKKLWPDFGKEDFKKAVEEYRKRERRFGG
ncbi:MAG: isoprenyl transferase [Candidatus Omnitrophica bacterium]|nr:isoprenyl transferase [Candidatus Omnitrophota bacterium]